jgi:hypothetical protein
MKKKTTTKPKKAAQKYVATAAGSRSAEDTAQKHFSLKCLIFGEEKPDLTELEAGSTPGIFRGQRRSGASTYGISPKLRDPRYAATPPERTWNDGVSRFRKVGQRCSGHG